jgi:hypothetical protein
MCVRSLYLPTGISLLLYGFFFAFIKFEYHVKMGVGATTGTVILPTLLIILGLQLLLAGRVFDVNNYTKKQ